MNNQNWGSALSKKQNYGGAIQPYIVYWTALNLKGEYASYKIVIKIFIFVEFGTVLLHSENRTVPNTTFPLFQIPNKWR